MKALDIATGHTLAFVTEALPSATCRVLEVGCGAGDVAREMMRLGNEVVAVDASENAVNAAAKQGLTVKLVKWPAYDDDPFDAILFTRSLHHISPLDGAVGRAKELLKPSGRVIVEDFTFNEVDQKGIAWLRGVIREVESKGLLGAGDSFARSLLKAKDHQDAWKSDHDHELQTAQGIEESLRGHFAKVTASSCPYFYRYACNAMIDSIEAVQLARNVFAQESEMIASGAIAPLGRRFVTG